MLSHVDANWFKFAIGVLTIFAVVANAWMRKRAPAIKVEADGNETTRSSSAATCTNGIPASTR